MPQPTRVRPGDVSCSLQPVPLGVHENPGEGFGVRMQPAQIRGEKARGDPSGSLLLATIHYVPRKPAVQPGANRTSPRRIRTKSTLDHDTIRAVLDGLPGRAMAVGLE